VTLSREALARIESHWAVSAIPTDDRQRAFALANYRLVREAYASQLNLEADLSEENQELLDRLATAYELAAIEGIQALLYPSRNEASEALREQAQVGAFRAFELRRVLRLPGEDVPRLLQILHLCALAYCGDRWADIRRWLTEHPLAIEPPSIAVVTWDRQLLYRLYECWVRLMRKQRWDDLDGIRAIVAGLREDQKKCEPSLLDQERPGASRVLALRLIALYHWARATELLAVYMIQGQPAGIGAELDLHFEAAREAAMASRDPSLDILLRWLHVAAKRMAAGSVWWVAHAVNSRVTRFVEGVTRSRALFELLPPQRAALQDQGLLDQAHKAVVVDMPTSGGKTLLAQFRMLQALNQFDADNGWVAYVAPTRALVAQITRRLRMDFGPLKINVEQLSPAVEIDSFEEAMLTGTGEANSFHVLVATPEKLHLVIRNKKVSRPLALVVLDEAQNIEDESRGLRIELLLATIKRDCALANFLLLMPYVPNAEDLANWLSPESGKAISLSTTAWQPNERIVGIYHRVAEPGSGDWSLRFQTLTTSPGTMELEGEHRVGGIRPLPNSYSDANTLTYQTAAMARIFSDRGTSIAVARTIPQTWSMARSVAKGLKPFVDTPDEIALVKRYLATEVSTQFELIELLDKGIGVHHAGLSDETRSLMEWLAEEGKLRVLCATTTIAQGINFPVSSVFLASRMLPVRESKEMALRSFWNLAGRAGRMDQDSVGVVGIAAGDDATEIIRYVSEATGDLISRLVVLLDKMELAGDLNNLSVAIQDEQWADFRRYIAHLWNDKRNLDAVLAETEILLRHTFGYGMLQAKHDEKSRKKARALLEATKGYARTLAAHPENAVLADSTGFAPEGVRSALLGLNQLEKKLSPGDWQPESLFGSTHDSILPQLIGVMMRIPELRDSMGELGEYGDGQKQIADIARAWVGGSSIEEIARTYFSGTVDKPIALTDAISSACKGIYRVLGNAGTWGLSALTKMPTSGIDFDSLTSAERRLINNLPAMLFHGVSTEAGVLMRMNAVPRSMAEKMGQAFDESQRTPEAATASLARGFLQSLAVSDWQAAVPAGAVMSGADYRTIWGRLSGEKLDHNG
jgi:hypothetical protein